MLIIDFKLKVLISLTITTFFLGSVIPRFYQSYERAELSGNVSELLDAAEVELKLAESRSVCPINNMTISIVDLVTNGQLNNSWLDQTRFSVSVQFRSIIGVSGLTIKKPSYIEVEYRPSSNKDWAFLSGIADRVSAQSLFFTKRINSSFSSVNSYIDRATGCEVN